MTRRLVWCGVCCAQRQPIFSRKSDILRATDSESRLEMPLHGNAPRHPRSARKSASKAQLPSDGESITWPERISGPRAHSSQSNDDPADDSRTASPVSQTFATPHNTDRAPIKTPSDQGDAAMLDIKWIRPSYGDKTALGKGMFPFKRSQDDENTLTITDTSICGKVTLVDLKADVTYNHVVDIHVEDDQITKIKEFVHTCPDVPPEGSDKLKWSDTPIRPPGNVLHCVNKKDLEQAFVDVWDARGVDDPMTIEVRDRTDISWTEVQKNAFVLVETIPEIYLKDKVYGVTLHIATIALLKESQSDVQDHRGRTISFQSPKKRRVT